MSLITKEINKKDSSEEYEEPSIWSRELEELLALWADKALCYRWLHDLAEKKFTRLNQTIQIPVIILSTVTGALNVGISSVFPESMKQYANISLGGVSLITGIISTIGNFLRYAQNMEGHRVASIQWSKFHRNIAAEIAIHPDQRQNSKKFFTIHRAELDRLVEQSPSIPTDIVEHFEKRFSKVDISKPEICNILEPTQIYKPSDGIRHTTHTETPKSMASKLFNAFKSSPKVNIPSASPKEKKNQDTIIVFDNNSNQNDEYIDTAQSEFKSNATHANILNSLNK